MNGFGQAGRPFVQFDEIACLFLTPCYHITPLPSELKTGIIVQVCGYAAMHNLLAWQ